MCFCWLEVVPDVHLKIGWVYVVLGIERFIEILRFGKSVILCYVFFSLRKSNSLGLGLNDVLGKCLCKCYK